MRVVGLISGGKDSIWNLHYCQQFGHEVTCLANLLPPEGIEELDSYMYQTVGAELVSGIASALGLPLLRRVITGAPRETTSQTYTPTDGDEVEDLMLLLQDVLAEHPDVQAVSCGAILSDYQRLRVESVCARLGLKVFSFLWRQEQPLLLGQMIEGGLDARIVKVASMGLDARHVGKSILDADFASYVFGLGKKYGVHVCGEGGEYESAVVDAPMYARKVKILTSEKVDHPEGNDVVWLRSPEVSVEAKESGAASAPYSVLQPYSSLQYYHETFPLLEPAGSAPLETPVASAVSSSDTAASRPASALGLAPAGRRLLATPSLDVGNLGLERAASPAEECERVLEAAAAWLAARGLGLTDALFVELQVRDLACFEALNAVYCRFFDAAAPSRVCIQTPLPESLHLRLRIVVAAGGAAGAVAGSEEEVQRLRVQSISTWAMACVGPYSQAVRRGPLLHTAGVLGLVPHSMTLPSPSQAASVLVESATAVSLHPWEAELWLTMRSLRNVLQVMGSDFGEACVAHVYTAGERNFEAVRSAVLAYMEREAPGAAPIIACVEVPRLPKDAAIEVSLVCATGGATESSAGSDAERVSCGPDGSVHVQTRHAAGVSVCAADFIATAGGSPSLQRAARECAAAARRGLAAAAAGGMTLQVQYCAGELGDGAVAAAVNEAFSAIDDASVAAPVAISYMPVVFLGNDVLLRMVAVAESCA